MHHLRTVHGAFAPSMTKLTVEKPPQMQRFYQGLVDAWLARYKLGAWVVLRWCRHGFQVVPGWYLSRMAWTSGGITMVSRWFEAGIDGNTGIEA